MIAGTVWNELKDTLLDNPTLSDYIKHVFEGVRFELLPEDFPCIMLEPFTDGEIEKDMNQIKRIYFDVNIYAFSSHDFNKLDRVIVGDDDYKGILDINNDIRACLQSSYTLGDNVVDITFQPTEFEFSIEGLTKYPVRGMVMPIKILYQQDDGV